MTHSTRKLGMMFTIVGWVIGLLLIVAVFSKILDHQNNPNQSVSSLQTSEFTEVVLRQNRQGHYVFDGEINHRKVTFVVDTGATTTAIPGHFERKLGLTRGPAYDVSTANGTTRAYMTDLDQLAIGAIEFQNLGASIVPGMELDEVLLGMNVLKHFELVQRDKELIIRQYR